jgi:hypothetical protein
MGISIVEGTYCCDSYISYVWPHSCTRSNPLTQTCRYDRCSSLSRQFRKIDGRLEDRTPCQRSTLQLPLVLVDSPAMFRLWSLVSSCSVIVYSVEAVCYAVVVASPDSATAESCSVAVGFAAAAFCSTTVRSASAAGSYSATAAPVTAASYPTSCSTTVGSAVAAASCSTTADSAAPGSCSVIVGSAAVDHLVHWRCSLTACHSLAA